jgi:hypothetical protein
MKICYFGIYKNPLSKDVVYLKGFQERGIDIVERVDSSRFFYLNLEEIFKKKEVLIS